jgi:hypothetical protein
MFYGVEKPTCCQEKKKCNEQPSSFNQERDDVRSMHMASTQEAEEPQYVKRQCGNTRQHLLPLLPILEELQKMSSRGQTLI